MTTSTPLVPLRHNRRFQLLWFGSAASALGTHMANLAYPLIVLRLTDSAATAGLVGAATLASAVLLGLPAGALVDRWDRRRILLGTQTLLMAGAASIALAAYAGRLTIVHILAVALIQGAGSALLFPAHAVVIRGIVPRQQLPTAFAQEEARAHGAALAGPPLGGVLFSIAAVLPFAVDAFSYLVSLVCIALAKVPRRPPGAVKRPAATSVATAVRDVRRDIADGLRWLLQERLVRAMLLTAPMLNLAGAGVLLLAVVLLRDRGVSPATIGLVLAAEGVAGLAGAALAARVVRLLAPGRLLLAIAWLWAALLALMPLPLGWWWMAVLLGAGVAVTPALTVAISAQILSTAPDVMAGRAMSALGTLSGAVSPLGPLLAGILAHAFGPVAALLIFGGYLAVCAAIATCNQALRAGPAEPADNSSQPTTADLTAEVRR